MLRCMKTKPVVCRILLFCLIALLAGCFRNDGTAVGKHPISDFYDDPQMKKLAAAGARGDVKTIDRLVSEGADVNRQGKEGIIPLFWAYGAQNEIGFLRLLELGADPNMFLDANRSVMSLASRAKNPAFLRMALEHGGNPNWTARNGTPIVFEAINAYSRDPLKLLIAAGVDLNAIDRSDSFLCTPLQMAAILNQYDIVYMLLEAGADYTLTNGNGSTMMKYLQNSRVSKDFKLYPWRIKSVEWLQAHGVEITPAN